MSCFILGDSIAVGLVSALAGCSHWAAIGKSAGEIAHHTPSFHYNFAVVSVGSNPRGGGESLKSYMADIRRKLDSGKVIWVVPANGAGPIVEEFASSVGDPAVHFVPSNDGVHPRSYKGLARDVGGHL